jgi:hypothetical protein
MALTAIHTNSGRWFGKSIHVRRLALPCPDPILMIVAFRTSPIHAQWGYSKTNELNCPVKAAARTRLGIAEVQFSRWTSATSP